MKNKLFVFMIDALCEFDVSYMRTLPNFGSILERGALVEEMLPVYPSFTYPCHVSIMTGCYPDRHGIPHNEMVQAGVAGKIAGFNVFESNNMDYENTTRVASKKTTTEFICGHPNWCHRVMEWQVPVHLQDLAGSGKYIGASAVQGRKVYGVKVSKPQTLYIKRTEA